MNKINIINLTIIGTFLMMCVAAVHAQSKHEISFSGFGGLSGLNYEVAQGEVAMGFGGGAGAGYHLRFNPQWGARTGLELAFFNSKCNLAAIEARYMTKDMNGADFEFRSTARDYAEKQSATMLQIPLMLQYQTEGEKRFYVAAGGKIAIPVAATYKTEPLTLQNSGWYEFERYLYDTHQFMGFGAFNLPANDRKLNLKPAFFISVEAGAIFALNDTRSIYVGIYLDYGVNNIAKREAALPQFIEYDSQNTRDFAPNSILNSQNSQTGKAFVEKVMPVAAGVKVGIVIN